MDWGGVNGGMGGCLMSLMKVVLAVRGAFRRVLAVSPTVSVMRVILSFFCQATHVFLPQTIGTDRYRYLQQPETGIYTLARSQK